MAPTDNQSFAVIQFEPHNIINDAEHIVIKREIERGKNQENKCVSIMKILILFSLNACTAL